MCEWPRRRLAELAAEEKSAISKPYGSAILQSDYRSSGIPVVRGVNLARGVFHDDDFVFIDDSLASRMPGAELHSGDLVVTHRGTIGQVSMIPRSPRFDRYVASTSHVKVRLDQSRAVPEFYYYWFASNHGRRTLLEHASAVGVPGIAQPVSAVKGLLVPHPPLAIQRGIAEMLGALDGLLITNDRRLKLIGQLADATFTREASDFSAVQATYAEIAEVGGGGTPRTSTNEYWDGGIPWATPTDVTALAAPYLDATARTITDAGLAACASGLYRAESILMTSRATIGAFAIAQVPVAVNQGFIVVNAKDRTLQWWLFHDMRARVQEFLAFANGATFLELPRGRFKSLPVRLPDIAAARKFNEQVAPLHALAVALVRENRRLETTRDELLQLLMSGKIRVGDAEHVVSEVL